jgi:transcriptional regulator with XRE-family HTH domain
MINSVQCKMARAALGWGVRDLAKNSEVSIDTITRLERGETLLPRTVSAIEKTFIEAGIEFFNGTGVKLHQKL